MEVRIHRNGVGEINTTIVLVFRTVTRYGQQEIIYTQFGFLSAVKMLNYLNLVLTTCKSLATLV